MEENQSTNKKCNCKTIIAILSVIIVVLAILLIYTKTNVRTIIEEREKVVVQNIELKGELDELLAEHEKIKSEYGALSEQLTDQDSVINAQAKEIEKLISSQADYKRIKKQLEYLRGITQGYVNKIDSLYQINQELVAENVEIKQSLKTEKQKTSELEKNKTVLEEQITSAAVLKAYNVNASAISVRSSGKEINTDKARKVNAIRVCFTIGENKLVSEGIKDVYLRIARPDNIILTQGSYSFIYQGNRIQYSEKTSVNFDKKSQNICITYQNNDIEFMKGIYNINLFADDHEIGQTSFELR